MRSETVWHRTPLLEGMRSGRLVVLDGVDRLAPGTIAALVQLVEDREITLFDGTRHVAAGKLDRLRERCARTVYYEHGFTCNALRQGFVCSVVIL